MILYQNICFLVVGVLLCKCYPVLEGDLTLHGDSQQEQQDMACAVVMCSAQYCLAFQCNDWCAIIEWVSFVGCTPSLAFSSQQK